MKKILTITLTLICFAASAQTISLTRQSYQRGIDSAIRIATQRVEARLAAVEAVNRALQTRATDLENSTTSPLPIYDSITRVATFARSVNSGANRRLIALEGRLPVLTDSLVLLGGEVARQQRLIINLAASGADTAKSIEQLALIQAEIEAIKTRIANLKIVSE
jgi:hypothetical protein